MHATMANRGDPSLAAVRAVLRTDVVDILRRELELLQTLTREDAYNAILDQPTMLDGCLKLFDQA